jgi:hypothetical protein
MFPIDDIFKELQLTLAIVSFGNWQSGSILQVEQESNVTKYSNTVAIKTGGRFPPSTSEGR